MKAVETQKQSSEHREIPEALLENHCKETAKSWTSSLREVFTVRSSTKLAFVMRSVKLKIQTFVTMTTGICENSEKQSSCAQLLQFQTFSQ